MRFVTVLAALIFAFAVSSSTLVAQGRGQVKKSSVSTPKAKTSTQTPKHTATKPTTKPTATKVKPATTKAKTTKVATGAKPDTRAAKTAAKADSRAAKAVAKSEKRAVKTETKVARNTETPTAAEPTPTLTTTVISPETPTTHSVKNPKLEARLLPLLPAGMNIPDASQGFKNWGQFVAAVHVSNNLGIPFADLKARMTGFAPGPTPGSTVQTAPMSLGQAIQSFKGTSGTEAGVLSPAKIQTEVKKAEDAANTDLRRSRETS
jgi:hypothetical protein